VEVAALAQRAQVRSLAVLRRVVEVGGRQHHTAAGFRMRLAVRGPAVREVRRAFAAPTGLLLDGPADRLPGLGIARTVFRADGHGSHLPLRCWGGDGRGARCLLLGGSVDFVKGERQPLGFRKLDEPARDRRGYRLPLLVERDIALRNAEWCRDLGLRDVEPLSNGHEGVHGGHY